MRIFLTLILFFVASYAYGASNYFMKYKREVKLLKIQMIDPFTDWDKIPELDFGPPTPGDIKRWHAIQRLQQATKKKP